MTPEIIADRYRIERAIGKGGGGTVWLCRDERLGRTVAIKQIVNPPGESSTETARAMREARHAAALNHPNVVSVYDVVEQAGQPWLIMEYVNGPSLSELIRAEGSLAPDRVARLGAQLAGALAHAHDAGIIHRDIKPGNAMIGPGDRAKVMDFGIARAQHDEQLTQTGFMSGTVTYFSPELARGEEPSYASDVWALGATLYAAVEGRPPYESAGNPLSTLRRIDASPYARPQNAGPLEPVLAGMMNRDPERRWTMQESYEALQEVAAGREVPSHLLAAAGLAAGGAGAAMAADDNRTQQVPTGHDYDGPTTAVGAVGGYAAGQHEHYGYQGDPYSGGYQGDPPSGGYGHGGYGGGYGNGGYGGGYGDGPGGDDDERRGGWVVPVVIGLILLLLAAVLFVVLTRGSSDDPGDRKTSAPAPTSQKTTAAPTSEKTTAPPTTVPPTTTPPTTAPPTTPPPTTPPPTTAPPTTPPTTAPPTTPPTTAPETTPPTTEPTTEPQTSQPTDEEPTLQEMSQTVRDYYNKLPGDTDGGWAMLSDRVQETQTRDGYDEFWGSIKDVTVVGNPEEGDNPSELVAVVRYTKESGEKLDELTTFLLVRDDAGNLRLDKTEVTSRTPVN